MKDFFKRSGASTVAILILALIVLGIISVIAIFCGFIMKAFGFEYNSVWNIILFFLIATLLSYPIGLFAEALPKVLHYELKKITLRQAKILYLVLDTVATAIGLAVVDNIMDSVKASDLAILVASFLLSLLGVNEMEKEKNTPET